MKIFFFLFRSKLALEIVKEKTKLIISLFFYLFTFCARVCVCVCLKYLSIWMNENFVQKIHIYIPHKHFIFFSLSLIRRPRITSNHIINNDEIEQWSSQVIMIKIYRTMIDDYSPNHWSINRLIDNIYIYIWNWKKKIFFWTTARPVKSFIMIRNKNKTKSKKKQKK